MAPREMAIAEFTFALVAALVVAKLRTVPAIGAVKRYASSLPANFPWIAGRLPTRWDNWSNRGGKTRRPIKPINRAHAPNTRVTAHTRLRGRASNQATKGLRVPTRIREHRMTTRMAASWPSNQRTTPVRIRATILLGAISNRMRRGNRLGSCGSFIGSCAQLSVQKVQRSYHSGYADGKYSSLPR